MAEISSAALRLYRSGGPIVRGNGVPPCDAALALMQQQRRARPLEAPSAFKCPRSNLASPDAHDLPSFAFEDLRERAVKQLAIG